MVIIDVSLLVMMGSSCSWKGALSPDDFNASAVALAKRWKEIDATLPQWIWMPCRRLGVSSNVEGYLVLEKVYRPSRREEQNSDNSCFPSEKLVDDATLVQSNNEDIMHAYDFHIVYSFSYRVPVLYFRGYTSDGDPLNLDDIEKDLPPYSFKILSESKWTFMTQEEHPYLSRPWYMLHPCGTSDWMKLLVGGDEPRDLKTLHYLTAWLSVVGQAVGMQIPIELYHKSL
ncbi:ubiquitin-like-conjugating enzyme ATG10 isoform X2 [Typha angustifolia]|uniref:ubiquitin-like-conjugating enzyme ATG10 isoform X2 n=1 Tax=Typha angustifolia TaxID=59011 RepID=UPI003C2DDA17